MHVCPLSTAVALRVGLTCDLGFNMMHVPVADRSSVPLLCWGCGDFAASQEGYPRCKVLRALWRCCSAPCACPPWRQLGLPNLFFALFCASAECTVLLLRFVLAVQQARQLILLLLLPKKYYYQKKPPQMPPVSRCCSECHSLNLFLLRE